MRNNSVGYHEESTAPGNLADLVSSFLAKTREQPPQSFSAETGLRLSQADIWDMLDCGLLVSPYFSVFWPAASSAVSGVIETRSVVNRPTPAYANAAAIRERFAAGCTLRLNEPDHWHRGINKIVTSLRAELSADVRSFVFLSPPAPAGGRAPLDDAHVLILPLEGTTEWHVGLPPGGAIDDVTEIRASLEPGHALYIPSGHPHSVAVSQNNALYVAVTMQQPSVKDLAEVALADFINSPSANSVAKTHHFMSIEEKVGWLKVALAQHLSGQDIGPLVAESVRIRQLGEQA